ncbi:hypothetical protein [Streptomyces sp. NPDC045251]|uniref:hypothetical protein n=1 Tax=unclassified Streptomyces TaxID=2593676 RepID=UPI0033CFE375
MGTILWGACALANLHTETENILMLSLGAERFTQVYAHGTKLEVSDLIDIRLRTRAAHRVLAAAGRGQGRRPGPLTPREREVAGLVDRPEPAEGRAALDVGAGAPGLPPCAGIPGCRGQRAGVVVCGCPADRATAVTARPGVRASATRRMRIRIVR